MYIRFLPWYLLLWDLPGLGILPASARRWGLRWRRGVWASTVGAAGSVAVAVGVGAMELQAEKRKSNSINIEKIVEAFILSSMRKDF